MTKPSTKLPQESDQSEQWTETDIYEMITNPIYVGLGPFPPIITEETFSAGAERFIRERGVRAFISLMLSNLRVAFDLTAEGSYDLAVDKSAEIVLHWLSAYPETVFPGAEPGQHGKTVDACSAAALRAILPNILADLLMLKDHGEDEEEEEWHDEEEDDEDGDL